MKYISIFDIVGPIMVGPSSSHTAGAVRLGLLARKIYTDKIDYLKFVLYNSFAKTGKGHGTDKGLLGGVLGFNVDDTRIRDAKELARKKGIKFDFEIADDPSRHPNSVDFFFSGKNNMKISGNSLGAGEVQIAEIDDFKVDLRGDLPTLLLIYKDQPGVIWQVSKVIQQAGINIASLSCDRMARGQEASMSICLDSIVPEKVIDKIKLIPDMYLVKNIEPLEK